MALLHCTQNSKIEEEWNNVTEIFEEIMESEDEFYSQIYDPEIYPIDKIYHIDKGRVIVRTLQKCVKEAKTYEMHNYRKRGGQ